MAVPTNAIQTFAMVGIKEDLSDIITLMETHVTPVQARIKKGKCTNRTPEWQIDEYAAADAENAVIEGDDASNDSRTQPSKVKNHVQLMDKTLQISSSAIAVAAAGRVPDEANRQAKKMLVELKGDFEKRLCGNYPSVAGASGTAGKFAGMLAWLTTNVDREATGVDGGYNSGTGIVAAATNGVLRNFAETQLTSVFSSCHTNAGNPTLGIMPIALKQKFSAFVGVAPLQQQVQAVASPTILGSVDYYKSDIGTHEFMASRFCSSRDVLLIDPEGWELLFLQAFQKKALPSNGHSERSMIWAESTVRCWNEKKSGAVADVQ